MEIKYKNNIEDLVEINNYLRSVNRNWKIKLEIMYYAYILFGIYMIFKFFILEKSISVTETVVIFLIMIIWILYFKKVIDKISTNNFKRKIKRNPDTLSEKILILKDNKIEFYINESNYKTLYIKDIYDIVTINDKICIFLNSASLFAIIPDYAFLDKSYKDNFIKKISIK